MAGSNIRLHDHPRLGKLLKVERGGRNNPHSGSELHPLALPPGIHVDHVEGVAQDQFVGVRFASLDVAAFNHVLLAVGVVIVSVVGFRPDALDRIMHTTNVFQQRRQMRHAFHVMHGRCNTGPTISVSVVAFVARDFSAVKLCSFSAKIGQRPDIERFYGTEGRVASLAVDFLVVGPLDCGLQPAKLLQREFLSMYVRFHREVIDGFVLTRAGEFFRPQPHVASGAFADNFVLGQLFHLRQLLALSGSSFTVGVVDPFLQVVEFFRLGYGKPVAFPRAMRVWQR